MGTVQNTFGGVSGEKGRVRSGEHPDPDGLFPLAKRAGKEIAGWQPIGRVYIPSAELSRTPSYPPLRRPQPLTGKP